MALRKIAPQDFELEGSYAPIVFNNKNNDVNFTGLKKELLETVFEKNGIKLKLDLKDFSIPVALRWRTSVNLGLPFNAFKVWRRSKFGNNAAIPIDVKFEASARGINFNNGPFVKVSGVIKNNGISSLTVKLFPKNSKLETYASKDFTVQVAANSTAFFTVEQPNIYGVESNFSGIEFSSLKGVTSNDYINDKNWELIQIVGLPVEKGYIKNNLYNYEEQGFINSLQKPFDAAVTRLVLHKTLYNDSPAIAPDGRNIPIWKVPVEPELIKSYYLNAPITNGVTGVLNDINEMFSKVYDVAPELYNGKQSMYTKKMEGFGMHDEANTAPKKNGSYLHPVCAATLLSASSDCWNALGLGFGTTDFLPYGTGFIGNPKFGLGAFDYMVTAQFKQPITELFFEDFSIKEKFAGFDVIEYAAICYNDIILPIAPATLLAEPLLENRPVRMDDFYYEQERISWQHQAIQQKHPFVFSIAFYNAISNNINYLNQSRPFLSGNLQPLLPAARSDEAAQDVVGRDGLLFDKFVHDKAPVPFFGNANHKYYVAAQDVFGVWSSWSVCTQTLISKPAQKPDIVSAKFTDVVQIANTAINQATLEIIFNWHWEDRSPFEIRFTGHFFTPPTPYSDPAPWAMPGIALGNGIVKRYAVRFALNGTISLFEIKPFNIYQPVPLAEGKVIIENSFSTGNGHDSPHTGIDDTRTYKLFLYQMQISFLTVSKLYYAVETVGFESVNPSLTSPPTLPYVITVVDPNPKLAPVFFTDIKWASLPDVSNVSRYHLTFPSVAGAVGYAVYRATETSLSAKFINLNFPNQGSIFQRRNAFESANAADKNRGFDAFIRVNKELITDSTKGIELEMNGDVGGLYIYAVSSFTDQNVESKLSNWIYVAIPQRITPSVPSITGYINKKLATPKLVVKINVGLGNNTDTVQLYKTSRANLAADLNIMGLPYSTGPNNVSWKKYKTSLPTDILIPAASIEKYDYLLYEEDIQPSWQTVFLRTAALGKNSPADGLFPGKSASSNLLELIPPIPALLAQILNPTLLPSSSSILQLSFKTNAFLARSNYGNHIITVSQQDSDGIFKEIIKKEIPNIIKIHSGDAEAANELYRLEKDTSDFVLYHFNMAALLKVTLQIKVTDPAGRNSFQAVSYEKPLDPPPSGIIINDVTIKKQLSSVLIEFKTNVGKRPPLVPAQATQLSVIIKSKLGITTTIIFTVFNVIPDKIGLFGSGIYGGVNKDINGLYSYNILLKTAAEILAIKNGKVLSITIKPFKKTAVTSNTTL
jgi:hypothetical protein